MVGGGDDVSIRRGRGNEWSRQRHKSAETQEVFMKQKSKDALPALTLSHLPPGPGPPARPGAGPGQEAPGYQNTAWNLRPRDACHTHPGALHQAFRALRDPRLSRVCTVTFHSPAQLDPSPEGALELTQPGGPREASPQNPGAFDSVNPALHIHSYVGFFDSYYRGDQSSTVNFTSVSSLFLPNKSP
ncbi:uncharacterized protein LOC122239175 isoform X2 [Panthera tigris]|uniref:uncharacterized protein LOC122239175 isoform X2 n=1 Tax=Panthera tigris TaxID=9694 RepID=UPI001C6F6423|nr:uncharacterized protein LOC122239175 isoform X2 [Panthera tigris]